MRPAFYDSPEYRARQSAITKRNQDRGVYNHLNKHQTRTCARQGCRKTFVTPAHDPKRFCSRSCSAKVSNISRGPKDEETKQKISVSLKRRKLAGIYSPFKGLIKVPRQKRVCGNPVCGRAYVTERWRRVRFCGVACAMRVIGGRPTSPKASRGKAGVRLDIDPNIYFYSRWEANMARLYSFLGIVWEFGSKTFDIGDQNYTPDFYLAAENRYVEVKNFWNDYSRIRDEKFRKRYPNIKLKVILREEYLKLEKRYAHRIPTWEYAHTDPPRA